MTAAGSPAPTANARAAATSAGPNSTNDATTRRAISAATTAPVDVAVRNATRWCLYLVSEAAPSASMIDTSTNPESAAVRTCVVTSASPAANPWPRS